MNREYFQSIITKQNLVFDGAMGTALQEQHLPPGVAPETYNHTHPEVIQKIHLNYLMSGCDVITTNTFGANALKVSNVSETIEQAINIAKSARKMYYERFGEVQPRYIALDIGPLGALLKPSGSLSFDDAYELFKEQVIAGVEAGCDFILIETITDLYEAKCAVLAAVEHSNVPVLCTMSFESSGRTFLGTDVISMVTTLEGLGVSAIGFNCSFGAQEMIPLIEVAVKETRLPLMVQPNAGLPQLIHSVTVFDKNYEKFESAVQTYLTLGVSLLGGCCGTDAEHIKLIRKLVETFDVEKRVKQFKPKTRICSYAQTVTIGEDITVIGERLNPTGKKLLKEALLNENDDYVIREALIQVEQGAAILDLNVGVPGINEAEVMTRLMQSIQSISSVPLQLDSSSVTCLEQAVRYYNGKPLINSVNGKRESLEAILPIAKKYGACVLGLTLDDDGIPPTAEGRVQIARRIIDDAEKLGIPRENILIDCLALTASAQQAEVFESLKAIERVTKELGVQTVLGVSNVSFGLPQRSIINLAYLTMALYAGLKAPIINPDNSEMMAAIAAYEVLSYQDVNATKYIEKYAINDKKTVNADQSIQTGQTLQTSQTLQIGQTASDTLLTQLETAIEKGLKMEAVTLTREALSQIEPLEIVEKIIIPSLNKVGLQYEAGRLFLPQLIQSAETVQNMFVIIKEAMSQSGQATLNRGKILLATVKNDIHDIGKNIVKVVLENYGYQIYDLGKDVAPERILEVCQKNDIHLVGLSALMTTTVVSMQETVELLKSSLDRVTVVVGGAVLSEEVCQSIGADAYAKDASDMIRIAETFFAKE